MTITTKDMIGFRSCMIESEKSQSTVSRYMAVAQSFAAWLGDRPLTKENLILWRGGLEGSAATVNVAVSAVNKLMEHLGRPEMRLKQLRTQRRVFRPKERELSRGEYERLVCTAERQGKERLARIIETICVLGIRVSELRFITAEALDAREVEIRNKGKQRTILLNAELVKKLRKYCRGRGIRSGPVFVTGRGKPVNRTQIWAEMKRLCAAAGVEASKVFPHNLRHLFAVTHYRRHKDIVRLADLLGHSSVNTTRIYLMTSGEEHERELEEMGLVLPDAA